MGGRGEGRGEAWGGERGRASSPFTDCELLGTKGGILFIEMSALHGNEHQMKAEQDQLGTCSPGETRWTAIPSCSLKRKGYTVTRLAQEGGAGSGVTYPRFSLTSRFSNSFTLSLSQSLSLLVFEWDNTHLLQYYCDY